MSIRAADGPEKLLQIVKNPVTDHLPAGCLKIGKLLIVCENWQPRHVSNHEVVLIGTSVEANKLVDVSEYVTTLPDNQYAPTTLQPFWMINCFHADLSSLLWEPSHRVTSMPITKTNL